MVISQPSYLYKRNTAKILQNMNQNFKIHTKVLCLIYQTRLFFWFLAFIHVFFIYITHILPVAFNFFMLTT